jgi:small nuclear ribonucleoprotein (snRNP)-like protein
MPYRYKEKFEKDNGYRFFRDKKSVLVHAISYGRRLTEGKVAAYDAHTNRYLDAVMPRASDSYEYAQALRPSDFPDVKSQPLYKYVSDATWEYIRQGSFQFGTAQYYRNTPNRNIQDQREGASSIHLTSQDNQLNVTLTSGFNCAIFCGTAHIEGPEHELMLSRFGRKRLKIEPLMEFLARVCRLTGSFRAHVKDVVYNDLKNYVTEHAGIERFYAISGRGDLTNDALRQINEAYFGTFDEYGFMPSLFAKPTRYSQERERRLIFEMRDDLRKQTVVVKDKSLLDFVTLVDSR